MGGPRPREEDEHCSPRILFDGPILSSRICGEFSIDRISHLRCEHNRQERRKRNTKGGHPSTYAYVKTEANVHARVRTLNQGQMEKCSQYLVAENSHALQGIVCSKASQLQWSSLSKLYKPSSVRRAPQSSMQTVHGFAGSRRRELCRLAFEQVGEDHRDHGVLVE